MNNNNKYERQTKILELIKNHEIETQDELNEMLRASGFSVTQATISRDIRELKIIKVNSLNGEGRQKYAVLHAANETQITDKFKRILKDGIVSMKCAQNILVIKTIEGMAQGVAAFIDSMTDTDIIGTVAGENTILCIVRTNRHGNQLMKRFYSIIHD